MTAIVKTWHWQVSDVAEFKKLHRVFEDKHMKKTGASKMHQRSRNALLKRTHGKHF